jgi:hypothetical protein
MAAGTPAAIIFVPFDLSAVASAKAGLFVFFVVRD